MEEETDEEVVRDLLWSVSSSGSLGLQSDRPRREREECGEGKETEVPQWPGLDAFLDCWKEGQSPAPSKRCSNAADERGREDFLGEGVRSRRRRPDEDEENLLKRRLGCFRSLKKLDFELPGKEASSPRAARRVPAAAYEGGSEGEDEEEGEGSEAD